MGSYRAKGKFLITGEYLVLKGAKALAIPLQYGQSLNITPSAEKGIRWNAFERGTLWFSAQIDPQTWKVLETTDELIAKKLSGILAECRNQNPQFLTGINGINAHIEMDFDREWGLGSSSTLISLLAQWSQTNPYEILKHTFGGSGYDIACATAETPVFYSLVDGLPVSKSAPFQPPFASQLYFVYSGQKQHSGKEIAHFDKHASYSDTDIQAISNLTLQISETTDFQAFCNMINSHEKLMGEILKATPVKKLYFNDFDGEIKSLGAWGGDFMLVASERHENEVKEYFRNKGLSVIFNYNQMAYNPSKKLLNIP